MQITNIVNCNKPKNYVNFTNKDLNAPEKNKKRYKHFEQLSDEALKVRSLLKAHNEVAKSNKMRVYNALPGITTALTGASLALAQPGKLATKAKTGLGFLALGAAYDVISNHVSSHVDKKYKDKEQTDENISKSSLEKTLYTVSGTIGVALGAVLAAKKINNAKCLKPAVDFVKAESDKFTKEINDTKLAKFFENTITPFTKKHSKLTNAIGLAAPFGIIAAGSGATVKLGDSLSKDLKEKTSFNYAKGKFIQQKAREHFETIDADEV